MTSVLDLSGRTVLLTGGSRGIGRAACLLLSRAGADIAFAYRRDHEAAHSLVEEIRLSGRHALAVQGDVADRRRVEQLFEQARRAFGRIDIAIGNAGIWKKAPIEEMGDEEWQEMLEQNLKSVYLLCQLAAREMKPRRSGKIILVSSTAGQRGEAFHSHYAASKGGIVSFTKSLAAELGPWNIHVNCVAPGWVETDMTASVFRDPEFRREVVESIPLRRLASPEDIAGAILFLASPLADYVQGEVLNVNGGSVLCG